MAAGASQICPGWRAAYHSAPGDRLLASVLWGSSGSAVLVKNKQGSVCSILGVWVAVSILSLPILAQPGLATGLEWKALSLSMADDTPRLSFARSILWLSIAKEVLGKTSQEREQLVEEVRTGVCKGCGLQAPVHSLPGARYKAADSRKGFPSFLAPNGAGPGRRTPHPLSLLFQSPQPSLGLPSSLHLPC